MATLDRNGLRPCRFVRTRDGLVVIASEVGVLDIPPSEIIEAGRLEPGRMLVVDTLSGRVIRDGEVKRSLAARQPYRQWLDEEKLFLADQRPRQVEAMSPDELHRLQIAFGYTQEDLRLLIGPMARDGAEPVGSMGDDTPLAALSERPKLLSAYFKQHFAQVTNPPIDPQREALVMSLRTTVGAIGNLLDETPEHCRRVAMPTPVLQNGELAKLRTLDRERFPTATLSTLYPVADGPTGLERAVDALCREASRLVWDGTAILILSDRGVSGTMAPISPLLATAAVHAHLVREGARTMCGLVVESGEPREAMHFALLLGYGAAAVNPYLALESLRALHGEGELGDLTLGVARERYIAGVGKSLLKVCSKMGISTVQSYRGAQIFEAIGLGRRMVDRYFTGTVSRVGGLELPDLHDEIAERHAAAFSADPQRTSPELDPGGEYQQRAPRRASRVEPRHDREAATRGARRLVCHVPRVRRGARRLDPAADPARAVRDRAGGAAGPARGGRVVRRDREALRHRRDEPRLDLARGARDARHRDEPARRPIEHRRGRRGSGAVGARRERRSASICHQAGGIRALRRDCEVPASMPTSCRSRWRRAPSPARAGSCRATRSTR